MGDAHTLRSKGMKLLFATAVATSLMACAASDEPDLGGARSTVETPPRSLPAGPYRATQSQGAPTYLYERRGEPPDPRIGTTPILDPLRHRVMQFGGWSGGSVRSDTTEWDGIGWQRRVTSGQPGARFAAVSVYDARLRRTLMFGGFGVTSPNLTLSDDLLWEWNGTDWASVPVETAAPSRGAATMAQDPNTSDIWMFGGSTSNGTDLVAGDDLFKFDGTRWSKIEKAPGQPWPSARSLAAMAYDPLSKTILVFGGFGIFNTNLSGYPSIGDPRSDTWSWNGTSWTEIVTADAPKGQVIPLDNGAPVPLDGKQTMLFSERLGGMMMVHESLNGVEIWRFDPATPTWTAVAMPITGSGGPNFRILSSAFLDPQRGDIVVTGGLATGIPVGMTLVELARIYQEDDIQAESFFRGDMSNEQWAFDGAGWKARTPLGDPGPRAETSAAFDETQGVAVMYGGRFGSSTTLDDTWTWNGGHWTEATGNTPPARRGHVLAYDPGRRGVILFGGTGEDGALLNDTWLWNGGWSQLSLAGAPSPRTGHALLRTEAGVLLYGGLLQDGTHARDTWLLRSDGTQWSSLSTTAVTNSYDACAASGPSFGPFLFGGTRIADDASTDDFVQFDQASLLWKGVDVDEAVSANLGARSRCMLFADPSKNRVIIGGGLGGGVDENWNLFDPVARAWTGVTPRPYDRLQDPPRRVAASAYFFDPKLGVPTYYGGRSPGVETITSETWRVREVGTACNADGTCANGNTCVDGVCCESSQCGACESCAMPGSRGICAPLGVVGPTPGCPAEGGLSCNADGRCRAGDGAVCSTDLQCASGTCIAGTCCSAAGCTERCIDDETQRNPNGTETKCGSYACRGSSCRISCTVLDDCASGNVCNGTGQCVPIGSGKGQEPGGCSTNGSESASWILGVLSLALARRTRRK